MRKIRVLAVSVVLTLAMGMTAFAGNLSYQVTVGDTGKTVAWTNPNSKETMAIPIVTPDAKIILTGDMGQPIVDAYHVDSTLLTNDGFMADFSVYPVQDLDIADMLNRLDSNHASSPKEWHVAFPQEWVCFVGDGYGIPDVAFYVTSNPDVSAESSSQTASEGWRQDAVGWWWQNGDGSYPVNQWKEVESKWYYFDGVGYMMHDTVTPDGYLVGSDGAWIS